jgi:hypothetical protein
MASFTSARHLRYVASCTWSSDRAQLAPSPQRSVQPSSLSPPTYSYRTNRFPETNPDPLIQIPITAGLFFKPATSLWVLKLRFTFVDKTTWEGGDGCPHLQGNFGAADVEGSKEFIRGEGESWEEALAREKEWLV